MNSRRKNAPPRVLVLGGGPDAEREVSIASATAVHAACAAAGFDATLRIVDRPDLALVRSWETDVVFPVLHGRFGEGGALQTLLDQTPTPYIGCRPRAARLAMDKLATKLIAAAIGVPTGAACVLDPADTLDPGGAICPIGFPVVVKPVADGSSVGLHICPDRAGFESALAMVAADLATNPCRVYMIEGLIKGRELTASILADETGGLTALPLIEITPAQGVYDYRAKYARNDTIYTPGPDLADETVAHIQSQALRLCAELGVRHLARVDFILTSPTSWSLLEVNTMPGFTRTSLLPMAAGATGLDMPSLCARLVHNALNEYASLSAPIATPITASR